MILIMIYKYVKYDLRKLSCNLLLWLLFFSRAEELETALMEMVKQDNRRELSARVY